MEFTNFTRENFDIDQVNNFKIDDVDPDDYPEFCDAYISEAYYGDEEMTEDELEFLNDEYSELAHENAYESLITN